MTVKETEGVVEVLAQTNKYEKQTKENTEKCY